MRNNERFTFKDRGMTADIVVAPHDSGHWMWSTSWYCGGEGRGYFVDPKWGRFAPTREAVIDCARCEMEVQTYGNPKFKAWTDSLGQALQEAA